MSLDINAAPGGSRKPKPGRMFPVFALLVAATLLATESLASTPPAGSAPGKGPWGQASAAVTSNPGGGTDAIWQAGRGSFAPQPADGPALIRLDGGFEFDPRSGPIEPRIPIELRGTPPEGPARGYFIVQFKGPITQEDRAVIESEGGKVLGYIPDYALLVSLSGNASRRVTDHERVSWTGLYQPAYKISQDPRMSGTGVAEMDILLFDEESLDAVASEIADAGGKVLEARDNGINKIIRAEIDRAAVAAVARIPGVAWIEPVKHPVFNNDLCQWVIQTWTNGNRRIWDLGIHGEGQVISSSDSGIRTTHNQFNDSRCRSRPSATIRPTGRSSPTRRRSRRPASPSATSH